MVGSQGLGESLRHMLGGVDGQSKLMPNLKSKPGALKACYSRSAAVYARVARNDLGTWTSSSRRSLALWRACLCVQPSEVGLGCSFCTVPTAPARWSGADSWRAPGWWPWGFAGTAAKVSRRESARFRETFSRGLDLLHTEGAERLSVLGLSKGAEAALWLSVLDRRIAAVVALSPASVTWANLGSGTDGRSRPWRSSWTWRSEPLPFVPRDETWQPTPHEDGLVSLRGWYERSCELYPDQYEAAAIPVENTTAEFVLVAGGDDQTWPSLPAAQALRDRRLAAGLSVVLIARQAAGHRPRLPGEQPASPSTHLHYGGTDADDSALGDAAWPHILDALHGAGHRHCHEPAEG